ncbi:elongation factor 1-gamma [Irpex rosettiformis]|uniref:Elongation factor 1-gamma n=1 Tax=Irpex rosettiformis TaxID=378272 RepID=A0ACB8TZI8_9APHY|nr:elongation factor 1-gamma [Irpex rosettiformis]
MSLGTLWTIPIQPQGKRIRAAAAFAGLQLDLPESYVHFQDNKKPEFLAKFPHGKIPALETKDGFRVFETTAIARYIAALAPNSTLLPSDPKDAALVDQWISVADTEILAPSNLVNQMCRGMFQYTKPVHTTFTERALRGLTTVENHLATNTFLVGERITLADITLASVVQRASSVVLDAESRKKFPNTFRHAETIVNQPALKEIFGPIEYPEKALQFVPPPKEKKEAKPAAAPAPKAEKKPKKEEEDDEDIDLVPKEEPKAKNPLDSLPKSSFNLEDWKRAYSNKETRGAGGSLEWFYENFDKEGFSVWRIDYKYNDELTAVFMSSNLIGGLFARLEASRKYLFGSVGVLGEANNSVISGILITRGQDIQPTVEVAPDWESYTFKKLDLSNAEDKSFFEAANAWDLQIDGKKWADGKNFK